MEIVNKKIEQYITSLHEPAEGVRGEMEALASEKDFPIIGPEVGRFLNIVARSMNAKRVFEMGSGYGYSAFWFATALPEIGRVVCTDGSEKNRDKALDFLTRAGLAQKIDFHVGNAITLIEEFPGPYDIVFNDVDKEDYPETIEKAVRALNPGGLFITDNALWYGKVAENGEPDKATAGVLEFNRRLVEHPELETVILPIRDGLAVAVKK